MQRPGPGAARNGFQTFHVLVISLAHLVHDVYSSFLAPVLPLLIEKLGITYTGVGLLTVFQRLPSLLNPLVGLMADRVSMRYFIVLSPLLTTVTMSLLGLAPNYVVLAIMLFIMGVSAALFHVPGPVFIKQVAGERVGKGMSYYMLGGELARTLGPLIILGAVSLWTLEGTWRLIPFGATASLLLFLKLRRIQIRHGRHDQPDRRGEGALFRRLSFFVVIIFITFFRALMKSALTTFLPIYLTGRGASLWMGGISLSIIELAGAVGTFTAGSWSDRIGRRKTLLIVASATPLLMWLFIIMPRMAAMPILLALGFFLFANGPVVLALVQDFWPERPAFANGIYMTVNFSLSSVATVAIGLLGDWIGLDMAFRLAATIALGGIPAVLMLPRKHGG